MMYVCVDGVVFKETFVFKKWEGKVDSADSPETYIRGLEICAYLNLQTILERPSFLSKKTHYLKSENFR